MNNFVKFIKNESGAVTVDWVVLTASIVGIAIAVVALISGGVQSASNGVNDGLTTASEFSFGDTTAPASTEWNGMDYWDYRGIAETDYGAAGNGGATAGWIQTLASADAPEGFNYNDGLWTGDPRSIVYTSDDGNNYSVNGEVTAIADFQGDVNPL